MTIIIIAICGLFLIAALTYVSLRRRRARRRHGSRYFSVDLGRPVARERPGDIGADPH